MKPDVEVFFTNPMELARRCLASFTQAAQKMQTVSDFQNGHRQRLMEHLRNEVRAHQLNARANSQLEARCQQLEKRCQQLEQQLIGMQARKSPRNSPGFLSGMVSSRPMCRDSPQAAAAPSCSPYMDVVRRSRPFELAASAGGGDSLPMATSPQQTGQRQTSLLAKLFASPGVPQSPNNI
ncbi:hypothetical protein FJT64_002385 [Amphibalanus amphitrite]|uniref:Uncharacterized protein n=2 Tax=Amphibalanus amphitrite TaxID=1232801 RepID=A0A6A4WGN5_AMPAM|nr:uncharacterized protein LOC122392712 [Amphibalanus amphitrite]KAF0306637.1 hypothetical protein FJT64_002385 [Amphibalanus amphitrite]